MILYYMIIIKSVQYSRKFFISLMIFFLNISRQ